MLPALADATHYALRRHAIDGAITLPRCHVMPLLLLSAIPRHYYIRFITRTPIYRRRQLSYCRHADAVYADAITLSLITATIIDD